MTFKEAAHEDEVTDPPVVLHMKPKTGFVTSNYERHLNEAMEDIPEKIDSFESSGSGWIVDKFQTLDLKIATYASLQDWTCNGYVEFDYDDDDIDDDSNNISTKWCFHCLDNCDPVKSINFKSQSKSHVTSNYHI